MNFDHKYIIKLLHKDVVLSNFSYTKESFTFKVFFFLLFSIAKIKKKKPYKKKKFLSLYIL
jgi:hypothetical protein